MWNPDDYLKHVYDSVHPVESFRAKSRQEWREWRERLRQRFVQLLGGFPAEVPELAPVLIESEDCGTYIRKRIQIQTYARLYMPVYVLIPKHRDESLGAVIACHGHGYGSSAPSKARHN